MVANCALTLLLLKLKGREELKTKDTNITQNISIKGEV